MAAAMELGKTETKALVAAVMEEFNQMHERHTNHSNQ
ncbi:MAG: hypothetical protein ACLTE2_11740 [Eubacteriales bacterium]